MKEEREERRRRRVVLKEEREERRRRRNEKSAHAHTHAHTSSGVLRPNLCAKNFFTCMMVAREDVRINGRSSCCNVARGMGGGAR